MPAARSAADRKIFFYRLSGADDLREKHAAQIRAGPRFRGINRIGRDSTYMRAATLTIGCQMLLRKLIDILDAIGEELIMFERVHSGSSAIRVHLIFSEPNLFVLGSRVNVFVASALPQFTCAIYFEAHRKSGNTQSNNNYPILLRSAEVFSQNKSAIKLEKRTDRC